MKLNKFLLPALALILFTTQCKKVTEATQTYKVSIVGGKNGDSIYSNNPIFSWYTDKRVPEDAYSVIETASVLTSETPEVALERRGKKTTIKYGSSYQYLDSAKIRNMTGFAVRVSIRSGGKVIGTSPIERFEIHPWARRPPYDFYFSAGNSSTIGWEITDHSGDDPVRYWKVMEVSPCEIIYDPYGLPYYDEYGNYHAGGGGQRPLNWCYSTPNLRNAFLSDPTLIASTGTCTSGYFNTFIQYDIAKTYLIGLSSTSSQGPYYWTTYVAPHQ